jgi:hypothetical protein
VSVILLYRTRYTPQQFAKVSREAKRTASKASAPMSIWQRPDIPEAHLTLLQYEDLKTAQKGFEVYTGLASAINSTGFQGEGAPDALLMDVKSAVRTQPNDAPVGSLLSLSIRIAEPGYAAELLGDLDTVFQELDLIGGLLGWTYGTRVGMSEEVLGLGIWAKFSDFETSLPMAPKNSDLRVYRRLL